MESAKFNINLCWANFHCWAPHPTEMFMSHFETTAGTVAISFDAIFPIYKLKHFWALFNEFVFSSVMFDRIQAEPNTNRKKMIRHNRVRAHL